MPDEVARIGALSNGSNGQRSLESASLHFEPICRREGGEADREPAGEILSASEGSTVRASRAGADSRNPARRFCANYPLPPLSPCLGQSKGIGDSKIY